MNTQSQERRGPRTRTMGDDRMLSQLSPAMAYVPWQGYETQYDEQTALKRGTLFPSLDLPFKGGEVR